MKLNRRTRKRPQVTDDRLGQLDGYHGCRIKVPTLGIVAATDTEQAVVRALAS